MATTTTPSVPSGPPGTSGATRAGAAQVPARGVDPMRRQQAVAAWTLAMPFLVLFLVFTAGPVLASLGMSFTDIKRTDIRTPFAGGFIGIDNYTQLLADPLFRKGGAGIAVVLASGSPASAASASSRVVRAVTWRGRRRGR